MNTQKYFNDVVNHLLTQNKKCEKIYSPGIKESVQCKYRFNGLSCAIGGTFPDDVYNPIIDDNNGVPIHLFFKLSELEALTNYWGETYGISGTSDEIEFILGLQDIHDYYSESNWKYKLKDFARIYALKFNEGDTHAILLLESTD